MRVIQDFNFFYPVSHVCEHPSPWSSEGFDVKLFVVCADNLGDDVRKHGGEFLVNICWVCFSLLRPRVFHLELVREQFLWQILHVIGRIAPVASSHHLQLGKIVLKYEIDLRFLKIITSRRASVLRCRSASFLTNSSTCSSVLNGR